MSKLSFVSLVSYDYEYLIKSISSYYDIADEIILGLDENLISWSNLPINIDKNKVKNDILAMDCDGKIKVIEGNFHSQGEPMKNETYERNFLSKFVKDDNWIVSIDADEMILGVNLTGQGIGNVVANSEEFKELVENSDPNFQLACTWINLFKKISDGIYVKINTDEQFFIATKLKGQYIKGRETTQNIKQLPIKILHYSWCRSEDELYTKLKNWGHSQDFDIDKWLAIWKLIDEYNYMNFYNIHPLYPAFWPSLSLININEQFSVTVSLYSMRGAQHLVNGLIDLIQYIQLPLKQFNLLEVGSFAGESTSIFAKYANNVYAVDPWISYSEGNANGTFPVDAERVFDDVVKLNPNITKIKLTSKEAVKQFKDESLDVIYIDGDHSSAGLDIDLWISKVKKDGWITGHDYSYGPVKNDVNNRFGDQIKTFSDDSWAVRRPKSLKTSIIIGTYNHCEDLLKPCCEALIKYTNLEDKEIIIVSNGSKDNTKEYVESLGKPFKLLWFDDPLGYSKANNEGIKVAIGDYIVLLNNDAFLLPQEKDTWINMLLEPFRDEKVGITSPIKGHNVASNELFMMFFCVMIKKEIIEKIGLLDESFKSGCEDVDFSIRVKNSGYDIVQVPVTKDSILWRDNNFIGGFPVHHLGQRTIKEMPEFYETQITNNELLVKKHSKIYGFMHIALMGNWREIVSEQLDLIKKSGLFNNSKIFACIVGDHQNESLDLLDGIEILQKDNNLELFEFITLKQLIKFCKINVDSKIWYIHTKGVARPDVREQENHWRQYMQYFVIEKWQQCVEALNSHDVCGAEWFYAKFPDSKESSHFSGNFWWANSNYINTLDEIETSDRFDAERFIGSGHPKVKCFHNSYENLYYCNYTRDRYIS